MGKGDFHNTEKWGQVNITEWEEHAHTNGDETLPAYKKVRLLDKNGALVDTLDVNVVGGITINLSGASLSLGSSVGINGLVSLASGTFVSLNPGTNYIGLASVQGNVNATQAGAWNMGITGLVSLPSGTNVGLSGGVNSIGFATVYPGAVFPVNDNSGSLTVDWISGATTSIAALPNITIGAPLPVGTNFIGLASVQGNVNATQVGTWNVAQTALTSLASGTLVGLNPGANFIGLASIQGNVNATQAGNWAVSMLGVHSLASGTLVGLNPSSNFIGLVSTASITGQVTAIPSANAPASSVYATASLGATAVVVKSSAGRIYQYNIYNNNTIDCFLNFYDIAQSSVSIGITSPTWRYAIPAGGTNDGPHFIPLPGATALTINASADIAGGSTPSLGLTVSLQYI